MREGARGVALVGQLGEIEALTPVAEERVRIGGARKRGEGVVLALEGRGRTAEAEPGQTGRRRAVPGGEARIEWARVLGRIIGPGQEPACLLHGEAEGHRLPLRAQPEEI